MQVVLIAVSVLCTVCVFVSYDSYSKQHLSSVTNVHKDFSRCDQHYFPKANCFRNVVFCFLILVTTERLLVNVCDITYVNVCDITYVNVCDITYVNLYLKLDDR